MVLALWDLCGRRWPGCTGNRASVVSEGVGIHAWSRSQAKTLGHIHP